jgi:hypothetical protein
MIALSIAFLFLVGLSFSAIAFIKPSCELWADEA